MGTRRRPEKGRSADWTEDPTGSGLFSGEQPTRWTQIHDLAKVGVAGSNPVGLAAQVEPPLAGRQEGVDAASNQASNAVITPPQVTRGQTQAGVSPAKPTTSNMSSITPSSKRTAVLVVRQLERPLAERLLADHRDPAPASAHFSRWLRRRDAGTPNAASFSALIGIGASIRATARGVRAAGRRCDLRGASWS